MPSVAVWLDKGTVEALDFVVKNMSEKTGFELTRSDIMKQALNAYIMAHAP